MEDGSLQLCALNPHLRGRAGVFYEVFDCMARPITYGTARDGITSIGDTGKEHLAYLGAPLISLSQITSGVLVFVNRRLEKVNHLFFDKLVDQAMCEDCGLVTGITVDLSSKITHSGFTIDADGKHSDRFAGLMFSDFFRMPNSDDVRCVEMISDDFFATRREHLAAVGGLSIVSSSRMPRLVRRLILNASRRDLRVLVTPFAVATVEDQRKRDEEYLNRGVAHVTPNSILGFDPAHDQLALGGDLRLDKFGDRSDVAHNALRSERKVQPEGMSISSVPVSGQINARYLAWKYVIPLPPDTMMGRVGAQSIENFLVVADAWGQIISRHTPENATVMDIGCGCGRIARVLVNNPWIRKYIGFDVMGDQVQWCRNFVEPAWVEVGEFHWFDLRSEEYNPSGALKAEDLIFPAGNETVDVIFAASVFTHLFEADALQYLREIRRVLSPCGVALLTIHDNVVPGQRFSGTEARIDIDPGYFIELAGNAGLRERESIDEFCGQRLFLLQRAE